MPRKFLLLADGDPLPKAKLTALRRGRFTVALDGAAKIARRQGWVPNRISGDFDSLGARSLEHFRRRGAEITPTPDQNHTDLEKALKQAVEEGATSIWIAQGLGRRLDHSLANLAFLRRFYRPNLEILLLTETEKVRFARDQNLTLKGKKGRGFALIPFPACTVKSAGLAYELESLKLVLGKSESVANHASRAAVSLRIKGAALIIEET